MANEETRTDPAPPYPGRLGVRLSEFVNRVSWGAVWAGVMIALGMEVLFTLFGFFIGFGMYHWQASNPWGGISAWSTIWYLVTAGWSMFFGAWCAARLSGNPIRESGILQGITTWGLATIATILVVGVGSWAVLREGINVLSTASIAVTNVAPAAANQAASQANQAVTQVQANAGPVAQATAHAISMISLRIWGGVLLGFITAILGGLVGRAHTVVVATQDVSPGPTRLAA